VHPLRLMQLAHLYNATLSTQADSTHVWNNSALHDGILLTQGDVTSLHLPRIPHYAGRNHGSIPEAHVQQHTPHGGWQAFPTHKRSIKSPKNGRQKAFYPRHLGLKCGDPRPTNHRADTKAMMNACRPSESRLKGPGWLFWRRNP
jgi:hypothetical protein